MKPGLLSWSAQVGAHAAFVEAHRVVEAPLRANHPARQAPPSRRGREHRETLLHVLRDHRKHPFADLRAALPHLSSQGVHYLIEELKTEGRLDYTARSRTNRAYFLPRGERHEH